MRSSWTNAKLLHMASLSLAGGAPLAIVLTTIPAWLAAHGVSAKEIGLIQVAGMPWTFKFLWSPFMDRWRPPFGGRRRGWIVVAQAGLLGAILSALATDPRAAGAVVAFGFAIAFFSATQDIAMDGYAVEVMTPAEQGPGNAMRTMFYRLGMILAGAGALIAADHLGWPVVWVALAALMLPSALIALTAPEPDVPAPPARTLEEAVIGPLVAFFRRDAAVPLALFIFLYKFGDNMAQSLLAPFFQQELHVTLTEIGLLQKTIGVAATIGGVFVGGALLPRIGLVRALWSYGAVQALANGAYAATALSGGQRAIMYGAVVLENLGAGLGTSALLTLCMRVVDKRYTVTQFALLTSLFGLGRTLAGPVGGFAKEALGWPEFFGCAVLASLPGLLLLVVVTPKLSPEERA